MLRSILADQTSIIDCQRTFHRAKVIQKSQTLQTSQLTLSPGSSAQAQCVITV